MRKAKRKSACSLLISLFITAVLSLFPATSAKAVTYSGQTTSGNTSQSKTTKSASSKTTQSKTGSSSTREKNPIISKSEDSDSGPGYDKKATPSNVKRFSFGWQLDDVGWWYRISEKEYIKNGWAAIDGKLYCFNEKGYMVTGWVQIGEDWYYLETDGHMVTGNYKIDKTLFHFDKTGKLDLDHYDYGDFPPQSS